MTTSLNPRMLALIENERQFQKSISSSQARRVKIEKPGDAWHVRFLPVEMGESKSWFVRQAQHWMNKTPIACPRHTLPDFGGDPDAECPVCALAEQLEAEHDDEVSNFGWRLRVKWNCLTFCVVYEIDTDRESKAFPQAEVLFPWEFILYSGTFDELCAAYGRGGRNSEFSVMDLYTGNNFWATKTTKGIRLDRDDPCAIFTEDDKFDEHVDKVFSRIKEPRIKIPSREQIAIFARKAEAVAYGDEYVNRDSRRSGRGRSRGDDQGDDQGNVEQAPRGECVRRPSRAAAAPAARTTARPAAARPMARQAPPAEERPEEEPTAEPGGDEDQLAGAEVPPRAARPVAARPAAARPAAARPAAATARPATAAAHPTTPAAAKSAQRAAAHTAMPRAANRAPAPATRSGYVQDSVSEEEDPGVAEEARDAAPSADVPLPADNVNDGESDDAPPAPHPSSVRRPSQPNGPHGLRNKIAAAVARKT